MKKLLAILAVAGILAAPVFAAGEIKEAIGTVDSINPISPSRGNYDGGIMLKDTDSPVKNFDITTTTVISDQATGKIKSKDIQDGDKVKITYTESDSGATAVTILRLPAEKN